MTSLAPVLAIGELLWDLLPSGPRLGGAPFNAVARLASLGHPAALVTAVGDDDLGRRALAGVTAAGVGTGAIQVAKDRPTGTVDVRLDPQGIPAYLIHTPAAHQLLDPPAALRAAVAHRPGAIILGTLAQQAEPVRVATGAIIEALPEALVVYDANLRDGHWTPSLVADLLREADVLRCNEDELAAIGGPPEAILERYVLRAIVVTRGAAGAVGWSAATGRVEVEARPLTVIDTVGAGDAFTAGVTHAFLGDASLEGALRRGAVLAEAVLSRNRGSTGSPDGG